MANFFDTATSKAGPTLMLILGAMASRFIMPYGMKFLAGMPPVVQQAVRAGVPIAGGTFMLMQKNEHVQAIGNGLLTEGAISGVGSVLAKVAPDIAFTLGGIDPLDGVGQAAQVAYAQDMYAQPASGGFDPSFGVASVDLEAYMQGAQGGEPLQITKLSGYDTTTSEDVIELHAV